MLFWFFVLMPNFGLMGVGEYEIVLRGGIGPLMLPREVSLENYRLLLRGGLNSP